MELQRTAERQEGAAELRGESWGNEARRGDLEVAVKKMAAKKA